jgi:exodeoxyribonuclease-3
VRLRIATWNINSLRLRLPLLPGLIAALDPEVICLQETKVPDPLFPEAALRALGYPHVFGRGMKGYNGVAILSRLPFSVLADAPDWCNKGDSRHLAVALDCAGAPVVLHNFYIPAGGDIADPALNAKFAHKLAMLAETRAWFAAHPPRRSILLGDLNVAPLPSDVWNHRQLLDVVSHTPVETAGLDAWMATGFIDAVRHFVPPPQPHFTWWSYRNRDWRASNRGRRLDHIWVSADLRSALRQHVTLSEARDWPQTSDHVPVCVALEV